MSTKYIGYEADTPLPLVPKARQYVAVALLWLCSKERLNPWNDSPTYFPLKALPTVEFLAFVQKKIDDLQQKGCTHFEVYENAVHGYRKETDAEFSRRVAEVEEAAMKFRTGFVSNSSSSSFVLITTVEYWQQVKQTLHPYVVAVAEAIMSKPKKALGKNLITFSTWTNHGTSWIEYLDVDYEGVVPKDPQYDGDSEEDYAWDTALEALRQNPDEIFEHETES